MIEKKGFNETEKFISNYEGMIPLVRTGTTQKTALESFCNALLLSSSKKFIIEDDNDKMRSIEKLDTDFKIIYRESGILSEFYNELTEKMHKLLGDFYNFIENSSAYKIDENPLLLKLLNVIFDDDENETDNNKTKVDLFITVKSIFTVNDFNKIIKFRRKSLFKSVEELKLLFMKDVKNMIKFHDVLDEQNVNSNPIISSGILLIDDIFETVFDSFDNTPELNPTKVCDRFFKIASTHFQNNIFIIDYLTEQIRIYSEYNPKLKSIILLSFDNDNYFEIVGKLRQTNIINRQFLPYEDVVQSILFHYNS